MTTATHESTQTAQRTTLRQIEEEELAVLPVHSTSGPSAAGLLNLSRWHAYKLVREGELPVLRLGGRILVPVPALRRMLGDLD
jgi:excisionase family DNA binding protein